MEHPNDDEEDQSGFKDDAEALRKLHIKFIRLGDQISASMMRITIVRGEHQRGTPASRELQNLAEHDMGDDVYDEETGVIDYQSLSPELRERTDALIEHSLRPSEYFGRDNEGDGSDMEESDVELRRRHGRSDEE